MINTIRGKLLFQVSIFIFLLFSHYDSVFHKEVEWLDGTNNSHNNAISPNAANTIDIYRISRNFSKDFRLHCNFRTSFASSFMKTK